MCCDDVYKVLRISRAPNPFASRELATSHIFRSHLSKLQGSLDHGVLHHGKLHNTPTAVWIDSKAALVPLRHTLADLAKQELPPTLVLVVYNLPNRDCAQSESNPRPLGRRLTRRHCEPSLTGNAKASVGEICCGARAADGSCSAAVAGCESGLRQYRDDFIAPLASILAAHSTVPVVIILEPDALPNLVTNRGSNPRCGSNATQHAYEDGILLALTALKSASPRVTVYLDAGHGAWLGWEEPARRLMARVCKLGLQSHIRGFSTNVANYNPLGVACPAAAFEAGETAAHWCHWVAKGAAPCCSQDLGSCGRQLLTEYSSGAGELMYAQLLAKLAREQCAGFEPRFVIDTSRNGNPNARHAASYFGGGTCDHWCNLRGARLGVTPTTDTALDIVDAFFWVKTPGESDGCGIAGGSDGDACARVDASCARPTALGTGWHESPAPDAGAFFAAAMLSLNSPISSLESGALGPDTLGKTAIWLLAVLLLVCTCGCGKPNHARPLVRSGSGALYAVAEDQPMLHTS